MPVHNWAATEIDDYLSRNRLRDGHYGRISHSYYDSAWLARGLNKIGLFQWGIGVCNKTYADTNLTNEGHLGATLHSVVERIRLEFRDRPPREAEDALCNLWTCSFQIGRKPIWEGSAATLLLQRKILNALRVRNDAVRDQVAVCLADGNLRLGHTEPTVISEGESFIVVLESSEPWQFAPLRLRVYLDGLKYSPIQ